MAIALSINLKLQVSTRKHKENIGKLVVTKHFLIGQKKIINHKKKIINWTSSNLKTCTFRKAQFLKNEKKITGWKKIFVIHISDEDLYPDI